MIRGSPTLRGVVILLGLLSCASCRAADSNESRPDEVRLRGTQEISLRVPPLSAGEPSPVRGE